MKRIRLSPLAVSLLISTGNVSADGELVFLGATVNDTALWASILDGTDSGQYGLEAANNKWSEEWDQVGRHIKISESTELSKGKGITHFLYDRNNLNDFLDSTNQRAPLFGGIIVPPDLLPPIIPLPPGRPVHPIEPDVDPDYGVRPPISHPIEPDVDPDYGVRPPIAHPIEPDVDPDYGVRPPISHPIEPGPEHPIEPPKTVAPEAPVKKNQLDNTGITDALECPQNLTEEQMLLDERYQHCLGDTKAGEEKNLPALTEGREFDSGKPWNVWANASLTRRTDSRFSQDIDTDSGVVAAGFDKKLDSDLIAGVIVNMENNDTDGFGSLLHYDSEGYNIGPYVAWYINDEYTMDISLMYGWLDNTLKLGPFKADFDSVKLTTMINLNTQMITEDEVIIKPRLSLEYTRTDRDAYQIAGQTVDDSTSKQANLSFSSDFSKQYIDDNGFITEPILSVKATYRIEKWGLDETSLSNWSGEIRGAVRKQITDVSFIKADLGYGEIGQNDISEWGASIFWSYQF